MVGKKIKNQTNTKRSRSNLVRTTYRKHNNASSLTTASSVNSINELSVHANSNAVAIDSSRRVNMEGITLVCFDLPFQSNTNLYSSLQEINDYIQVFTDSSRCLDWIQSSTDFIFFITSSTDRDLIAAVHAVIFVEAIFILNYEAQVSRSEFPKLVGVFNQHEELSMALRDTLAWFERGKLEIFAFEQDNTFLWSQLWKEKVRRSTYALR